jgi:hypothetical protein
LTLSNFSRQDGAGGSAHTFEFDLSWDDDLWWEPIGVHMIYVGATGSASGIKVSGGTGTARYRFTTMLPVVTDWLTFFHANAIWAPSGFLVGASVSSKQYSLDQHTHSHGIYLDPVGPLHYKPYRPFTAGDTSEIGAFLGFSFTDASTVGPADATTVYCSDTREERNLLNAPGSVANPLYSPGEAIQRAAAISRRYAHPVTVSIAGGQYELTRSVYRIVDGGTVHVVRAGTDPAKVYVNEDMDTSTLEFASVSPDYMETAHAMNTVVTIQDVDWRGVRFTGLVKDFRADRSSFELCDLTMQFTGSFRILDCPMVSTRVLPTLPLFSPNPFHWKWHTWQRSLTSYLDPAWVSSKWPQFQRFMPTPEATLVGGGYFTQAQIDTAKLLGFDPTQPVAQTRRLNHTNAKWTTGQYLSTAKIDAFATAFDAIFSNPHNGNWSTYDCVVEVRRCQFRAGSLVQLTAGLGSLIFTNNRYANNVVRLTARRAMTVENNTGDYAIETYRLQLGSANAPAKNLGWTGTHEIGSTYPHLAGSFLRSLFAVGTWSLQGNIAPSVAFAGAAPDTTQPSVHMDTAFLLQFHYGQIPQNPAIQSLGAGSTGMDATQLPAATNAFNAALDPAKFVDTFELRPLPGSSYVNAGPSDAGKNDVDGSRNDQGHLGGPAAAAALDARIFWLDSFAPQSTASLYAGMSLTLKGDRSTYSAARTPTFTWSATLDGGAWTPAGGWVSNGTHDGKNQTITLAAAGTYAITLVVDDGVATDNTTLTLTVSAARTFCVDSRKTEAGTVLGFTNAYADRANWTYWAPTGLPVLPYADGALYAANLDGAPTNAMLFRHTAQRTVTLPQANQRYYLKLGLLQEALAKNVNSGLSFRVLVVGGDGALLFDDVLNLAGSGLLTDANAAQSDQYGVGSCYFTASTNTSVTIIVQSRAPQSATWQFRNAIYSVYLALADEVSDAIYQDLRLAVRHAKPNDEIQVADCALDVPIRVAGNKIAFKITGGWDGSSHDGTVYTTRAWQTYRTTMNYLRFAWYNRQRDWAYSAISFFLPVYFPSEVSGIHIENVWPDKPNAWGYDAIDATLIMHAPVTFKDIAVDGVFRTGRITAVGDSLLNIANKLTLDNVSPVGCFQGLRVTTEHIDLDVTGAISQKVPAGALVLACKTSPTVRRIVKLWGNAYQDCGIGSAFNTDVLYRDDPIHRKVPSNADVSRAQAQFLTGTYVSAPHRNPEFSPYTAPVVVLFDAANATAWADLEAWENTWTETTGFETGHCVMYCTVGAVIAPVAQGAHHYWHDNTSTAGTSFIGMAGFTGAWEIAPTANSAIAANPADLSAGAAADAVALARMQTQSFVVTGNTLSEMRSVVDVLGSVPFLFAAPGHNVVVAGNTLTNVVASFWWGGLSGMFPAAMDKVGQWFRVDAAPHRYTWNLLPGDPQAPIDVLDRLVNRGQPAVQFLQQWS